MRKYKITINVDEEAFNAYYKLANLFGNYEKLDDALGLGIINALKKKEIERLESTRSSILIDSQLASLSSMCNVPVPLSNFVSACQCSCFKP